MSARQLLFAAAGADTSLDLNFLTGALDPRITFTRADTTPVASYFDASGTLRFGPVNLVTQSVSLAGWTLANTTNTGASGTAPDGGNNMVRIAETAVTNFHTVYNPSLTVINGARYTLSIYAKAAEDRYLQLGFDDGAANGVYATYDTQTGVISGAASATGTASLVGGGATITPVGAGIYRCTLTGSIPATAARIAFILCNAAAPSPFAVYAGNASNGLLVWGAQLEPGPVATQYIPTSGTASGGPRFDYDPVALAAKGLLIEEARTNLILRSTDITQAVWTKPGSPSVTGTPVAPDGTATGQTVSIGISSGPAFYQVVTLTSAARGEPSFWINPISTTGTLNISNPVNIANGQWSINMASLTAGIWQRITRTTPGLTITTEFSGTAGNQAGIFVFATSGTIDASWWGWQFEAGTFPTSYIPTSGSTATRAADVATMPTGSWFNQTAGTLQYDVGGLGSTSSPITLGGFGSNNGFADCFYIAFNANAIAVVSVITAGGGGSPGYSATAPLTPFRFATSWTASQIAQCLSGGSVLSVAATMSAVAMVRLAIGQAPWANGNTISGPVRRVRYWPRALSGPELRQATS